MAASTLSGRITEAVRPATAVAHDWRLVRHDNQDAFVATLPHTHRPVSGPLTLRSTP